LLLLPYFHPDLIPQHIVGELAVGVAGELVVELVVDDNAAIYATLTPPTTLSPPPLLTLSIYPKRN
jgi:hypothetical protein